jgi:HlyD family secretion protein
MSEDERDRAEARARSGPCSAKSAVDVAGHQIKAARIALAHSAAQSRSEPPERVLVGSLVDGGVPKLHQQSEGVVEAGQPLLEVGNPDRPEDGARPQRRGPSR